MKNPIIDCATHKEQIEAMIGRFCLNDDSETVMSDNQEWKIERGNSFIIARIYHNDIPVCHFISGMPHLNFVPLKIEYLFVAQIASDTIKRHYKHIKCTVIGDISEGDS